MFDYPLFPPPAQPRLPTGLPDSATLIRGARAAACRPWRWEVGMLVWLMGPMPCARRYSEEDVVKSRFFTDGIPDLRDPPTFGWLASYAGLLDGSDLPRATKLAVEEERERTGSIIDAAVLALEFKKPWPERAFPGGQGEAYVYLERLSEGRGYFAQGFGARAFIPNAPAFVAELARYGARTSWSAGVEGGEERVGDGWLPGVNRYALAEERAPYVRTLMDNPPTAPARPEVAALITPNLEIISTLRRAGLWPVTWRLTP